MQPVIDGSTPPAPDRRTGSPCLLAFWNANRSFLASLSQYGGPGTGCRVCVDAGIVMLPADDRRVLKKRQPARDLSARLPEPWESSRLGFNRPCRAKKPERVENTTIRVAPESAATAAHIEE